MPFSSCQQIYLTVIFRFLRDPAFTVLSQASCGELTVPHSLYYMRVRSTLNICLLTIAFFQLPWYSQGGDFTNHNGTKEFDVLCYN